MRLLTAVMGAFVVTSSVAACGLFGRGGSSDAVDWRDDPQVRELTLHVDNANFYDATLYALDGVGGGYRVRLGRVVGHQQETFQFRWAPLDLRIEIDLLAVGKYVTHSLPVSEGDQLELRIEPDLHLKINR